MVKDNKKYFTKSDFNESFLAGTILMAAIIIGSAIWPLNSSVFSSLIFVWIAIYYYLYNKRTKEEPR